MISQEFINGYLWAVSALRFEGKTIAEVEELSVDDHDFDRGAQEAVIELGDKCRARAIG